jgi:glycolate oxidase FAD binding subunit
VSRDASPGEKAFFGDDVDVVAPADATELAEALRDAVAAGRKVRPAGLGAHPGTADPAPGARLVSLAGFDSIVEYQPDDFTVGTGAGVPLATLRDTLAGNGQELPIDLPDAGTVGGLVARNHAGPRQATQGTLASLVLGVEAMRSTGQPFRAGGMVVKNVAGYALHKFVVGSLGRAGLLTRVNFRLRQIPERRLAAFASFGDPAEADALGATLEASGLEPASLTRLGRGAADSLRALGLDIPAGEVTIAWSFEGSETRVKWLAKSARELVPGDAERASVQDRKAALLLQGLVALAEPPEEPHEPVGIVRLSVPRSETSAAAREASRVVDRSAATPAVAADLRAGLVTVRWRSDAAEPDAPVSALANVATAHRGAARVLFLPPAARRRRAHVLAGSTAADLRNRVLEVFDPAGALR